MQTQLSKNETIIEFLISDFNDTSEHLKVTGRKIEFTFQLYAGFLSLLITLVVSLLTIAPDIIIGLFSKLGLLGFRVLYGISSGILILTAVLTWWVFEFTLRGSKMNSLYINRMNFLRYSIYRSLGKRIDKLDGFAYVLPKTKGSKVGMTDLFPLALQCIFSFFIFPAFCISVFLAFDPQYAWAQTHLVFLIILCLVCIILAGIFFILFERRWKSVVNDTERIILFNWGSSGVQE